MFVEIVYATQKGLQLLRFELHEMAGHHFLCLVNIHKVAEETNLRTFLISTFCIYFITAFSSTELGTDIVQELFYPNMAKISISRSRSNVQILTSTATRHLILVVGRV